MSTTRGARSAARTCVSFLWRVALGVALAGPAAHAGTAAPTGTVGPTEIKLNAGVNAVTLRGSSRRIAKGYFSNGSASSFATYSVYVTGPAYDGEWEHVPTEAERGIGYNFRNVESGDATVEAMAFYIDRDRLYAVCASKVGAAADRNGARKTPFDIEVEVFTDTADIPRFEHVGKQRSRDTYVDATEALARESFRH